MLDIFAQEMIKMWIGRWPASRFALCSGLFSDCRGARMSLVGNFIGFQFDWMQLNAIHTQNKALPRRYPRGEVRHLISIGVLFYGNAHAHSRSILRNKLLSSSPLWNKDISYDQAIYRCFRMFQYMTSVARVLSGAALNMAAMGTFGILYSLSPINTLSSLHSLLFPGNNVINAPKDSIHMLQTDALGLGNKEVAKRSHYEIAPHEEVESVKASGGQE